MGVATLQAELRRFEAERGQRVTGIQVGQPEVYISLCRLRDLLGLKLLVWLDRRSVRDGHVVLVA
jgi:hypothetical protein